MIKEKNCLFFFKNDLIDQELYKKINPKEFDISFFGPERIFQNKDKIENFEKLISESPNVIYIDGDRRMLKVIEGPLKGKIDKY